MSTIEPSIVRTTHCSRCNEENQVTYDADHWVCVGCGWPAVQIQAARRIRRG